MTSKHKLIGIRADLLDMAQKFNQAERLPFFEGQIAVCIAADHMETIVKILKDDAKALSGIVEGM